jgi:hypothetical protein
LEKGPSPVPRPYRFGEGAPPCAPTSDLEFGQARGPTPTSRWAIREVGALVLIPLQILHALVELFVGEVDEGAGFAELFLDGLVPNAFSFDMGGQAFG